MSMQMLTRQIWYPYTDVSVTDWCVNIDEKRQTGVYADANKTIWYLYTDVS